MTGSYRSSVETFTRTGRPVSRLRPLILSLIHIYGVVGQMSALFQVLADHIRDVAGLVLLVLGGVHLHLVALAIACLLYTSRCV